jgi:hypothetical protein
VIARRLTAHGRPAGSGGTRAGRSATKGRRAHTKRRAYREAFRVIGGVSLITLAVMVYLGLLANVTKLHYEIGQAQTRRALLEAQTQQLEERLNGLRSDDALMAIATKLKMHDPRAYAVVTLPPEAPLAQAVHDSGHVLLGAVAGLRH